MEKGIIVYVLRENGNTLVMNPPELVRLVRSLKVPTVFVATTEEEIVHGWSYLISKGVHQVSCIMTVYSPETGGYELQQGPLRICFGNGAPCFGPLPGGPHGDIILN